MNTTFNFNRLALLLKRYFTENRQREITYWAIITIVFIFVHQADSVRTFLYISGFIFAAKQFNFFNFSPGGMHYLLIPATHTEKLTSSIIISTVYYFIMVIITYLIGNFLGTSLGNMIFNLELPYEYSFIHGSSNLADLPEKLRFFADNSILRTFGTFIFIQAQFLLGSLYFKRNAAIKTMLSGFVFGLSILIIQFILFRIMYGTFSIDNTLFANISFDPENSRTTDFLTAVYLYGGYIGVVFFWIVSYFRLTEKQI